MSIDSEFMTVKEAAEFLNVSPNTLRSWGAAKKIAEYRHAVNNYHLFKRADLEELRQKLESPSLSDDE